MRTRKNILALALVAASLTTMPAVQAQAAPNTGDDRTTITELPPEPGLPEGWEDNSGKDDGDISFRFQPIGKEIKDDIFRNRHSNKAQDNNRQERDSATSRSSSSSSTQSSTESSTSQRPSRQTSTETRTQRRAERSTVTVTVDPQPESNNDIVYPPEWEGYIDDDVSGSSGVIGSSVDLSSLDLGEASAVAKKAVEHAYEQIGTTYVWGGTKMSNPYKADGGLDCSGFTQGIYSQAGITIPRVTFDQVNAGTSVSLAQIQPGDLVFYNNTNHVAVYIGDGKVIHAPQTGDVVKESPVNMMAIENIRRIA